MYRSARIIYRFSASFLYLSADSPISGDFSPKNVLSGTCLLESLKSRLPAAAFFQISLYQFYRLNSHSWPPSKCMVKAYLWIKGDEVAAHQLITAQFKVVFIGVVDLITCEAVRRSILKTLCNIITCLNQVASQSFDFKYGVWIWRRQEGRKFYVRWRRGRAQVQTEWLVTHPTLTAILLLSDSFEEGKTYLSIIFTLRCILPMLELFCCQYDGVYSWKEEAEVDKGHASILQRGPMLRWHVSFCAC